MSRWIEMRADVSHQAHEEADSMKVLKHLPWEQRSAAERLIEELVTYETFKNDEEFSDTTWANLYNTVLAFKEAIEANVSREILLAILDRESLTPKPVQGVHHGSGG